MDADTCQKIYANRVRPELINASNTVCGLGGTQLETLGLIELTVAGVGLIKALVVKGLGYPMILGSDELNRGEAEIDYKAESLTWFGALFALIPCPDAPRTESAVAIISSGEPEIDTVLADMQDVFDKPQQNLRACKLIECTIDTADARPIRQRAYRTALSKRKEISRQVDDMLAQGIIRPSTSPWASPITLVPKKSGELRFCVDYRAINAVTIKDSFPLPLIQDIFDQLQGAKVFTTLDMQSGYWQIPVAAADIPKTAFVCHKGLFEFVRMPFGLCNAPGIFQRTMERVLHGLVGEICLVYLDDVVVFGKTKEEHALNLRLVLERFRDHNLTLKPSKCSFSKVALKLLGYIVGADGISADPEKLKAIAALPTPSTVSQLRTFLGMSGYYRQLVPNYAAISQPLVDLTKKGAEWIWTNERQRAFEKLKAVLLTDVVLAYPRTDRPYKLYTDASDYAVGAILVQEDEEGVERVIHYLSHTLDSVKRRWATIEKEAYAIVYTLQKLRCYLWGSKFEIITDHKPLKSLFQSEIANTKLQRWAVQISEFGAPIRYKAGKDNARADMLSRARIPDKIPVCAVTWQLPLTFDGIKSTALIAAQKLEFPDIYSDAGHDTDYILQNDILFSTKRPGYEHAHYPRVLLPKRWRSQVVKNRHEQAGHGAFVRTLYHVQETYVWPGMCADIKEILAKCGACKVFATSKAHVHLGEMPIPYYPHQIVSMDLVGPLPRSRHGHQYLFTLIDHLTGWADAFPIANKTSSTIAEILATRYIPQYGASEIIISDNGNEFCNSEVAGLLTAYGIAHHRTTAYHPQANGKIERFHRTFKGMIKRLAFRANQPWERQVGTALAAYRQNVHSSVGVSPFQALYGRTCRLPLQNSHLTTDTTDDRVQTLLTTWRDVRRNIRHSRIANQQRMAKRPEGAKLKIGDSALLRKPGLQPSFSPKWEQEWVVKRVRHPTYWVTHLTSGQERAVHRSRLQYVDPDTDWGQQEGLQHVQLSPPQNTNYDVTRRDDIRTGHSPTHQAFSPPHHGQPDNLLVTPTIRATPATATPQPSTPVAQPTPATPTPQPSTPVAQRAPATPTSQHSTPVRHRYSFRDSTLAQSQHPATTTQPSSTPQTVSPLRLTRTADEWTVRD